MLSWTEGTLFKLDVSGMLWIYKYNYISFKRYFAATGLDYLPVYTQLDFICSKHQAIEGSLRMEGSEQNVAADRILAAQLNYGVDLHLSSTRCKQNIEKLFCSMSIKLF